MRMPTQKESHEQNEAIIIRNVWSVLMSSLYEMVSDIMMDVMQNIHTNTGFERLIIGSSCTSAKIA